MTNTTQHTPGPWTLGSGDGDQPVFVHAEHLFDVAGGLVCSVSDPRAEANARLISAAPDLLAFVRTIAQGSAMAVVGGVRVRQAWELMEAVSGTQDTKGDNNVTP